MRQIGKLTRAERRVLPYLAAGLDYHTAAAALSVAPTTVKNHRRAIEEKLEVGYRQLAVYALISGHVRIADIIDVWRQYMPQLLEEK